jgi:troponin T
MSEEEYSEEEYEEEEVEEEAEEAAPEHHDAPQRRAQRFSENAGDGNEGEKAMAAAKKRQDDDDNAKLQDYEEKRRSEREREEEELRILKEKQEKRRLEREEEERQMAELRQKAEEQRQKDEEERKARMEAERKKKDEEKMKRAQMMGGFASAAAAAGGGRNFTIPEKKDKSDKFGNIVQAKQEMGMTKEQQEEAKENFLVSIRKQIDIDNILSGDLKAKIKEMHHRICKLEAEKYDLEKRHERQTYDLRELNERSRQARQQGRKGAADPVGDGRHPNKIAVLNKYDRQIDRRNFSERRAMYEKKDAFPCFPNVPPPPTILEFKPKKEIRYDVYQNEEPEEEEEYEEEEDEEE